MKRFVDEDMEGAEFRECNLDKARLIGVLMQDAEIDGLVTNLVVNGVEVMEYVEWSALQTMRHLVFVHDSWFRRCCLGSTDPFTPMGLATEFVPEREEQGL